VDGETVRFATVGVEAIDTLTVSLGRAGIGIRSLEADRASLEDIFFRLTEHSESEAAA
jgi:hypothetical protein